MMSGKKKRSCCRSASLRWCGGGEKRDLLGAGLWWCPWGEVGEGGRSSSAKMEEDLLPQ